MKKTGMLVLCLLMQLCVVHADSYCVMVGNDNTIVEEKDMHAQQSVASISKIMTAVIAIENGNLDDRWQVSDAVLTAVGSSIYLKQGQEVSLKSLLYGLMLRSGNDAAIEIAVHIAGNEQDFVKKMNEKAQEIGMLNTVFENPSGLDEDNVGNLSTAYDMAVLMSYAMKNEIFREITGAQYYTNEWNLRWKNKNRLLFDYPFATGGKTGFTKHAGRTLVTTAAHDDVESIVVTLQTPDDFKFHEEKHTKTFQEMESVEVLSEGSFISDQYEVNITEPLCISLKKDGSDQLNMHTYFEQGAFVVEIYKNQQTQIFRYPARDLRTSWLRRLFS